MTVTELRRHPPERTAFVLGGGGNLGAIQVGMLRALVDRGERPDLVVGCSVGSLNGLALAADPTPSGIEELRRIWCSIRQDDIFPGGRFDGPWQLLKRGAGGVYPADGMAALIDRCAPFERLEDSPVPFQAVATNLHTGRAKWFTSGPIKQALLASTALPAAFPPVEIDGALYIDGAVIDNVPIMRAVQLGATRIVVLHTGNFERPRPLPKRPLDVLLQSFSISRNHRFLLDQDLVPDDVELIVVPGIDPGQLKRTDFTKTASLIERATASTAAFLDLRRLAANERSISGEPANEESFPSRLVSIA